MSNPGFINFIGCLILFNRGNTILLAQHYDFGDPKIHAVLVVFDIRNSPRPLGDTGTFRDVENLLDRITRDHNLLLDKGGGYGWIMND